MNTKLNDKAQLKVLEKDILDALQAVGKKHGVTLTFRGGTFDGSGAYIDWKLRATTSDEKAQRESFEITAQLSGVSPKLYGKKFTSRGESYKVIAFKGGRSYKIICERDDGTRFLFDPEAVERVIKQQSALN